jgi:ADP-ribosylation factor GTPase-activating protein 2/3
MGVHTTFVRSVDLDEWTQRQMDVMRLGGNANARDYFRKHGFADLHGKTAAKYISKASQAYRTVLAKLVEGQAAQRGEGSPTIVEAASTLLENLSLAEEQQAVQKNVAPVQPTAKLASERPGAKGSLRTPPSSGNGPKLVLRKLSSGTSSTSSNTKNLLKSKKAAGASKLRVNKLSVGGAGDNFEDISATQKAAAEAKEEAQQVATNQATARNVQQEFINTNTTPAAAVIFVPAPAVVQAPPVPKAPSTPIKAAAPPTMDQSMAKLKAMNSDFFADM